MPVGICTLPKQHAVGAGADLQDRGFGVFLLRRSGSRAVLRERA
jgi:hypothetical protein